MEKVRVAAIIPARMASSRFPGKPLVAIQGLPMIEHVRRRALMCQRFSEVVVATCDREIADVVEGHGGKALMTSAAHPAATDRVAEAAGKLDCSHVVNLQGDELLVLPTDLDRLVLSIQQAPEVPVWNAVARIDRSQELSDPSIVKCAVSGSGRVLFCSRVFSEAPGQADNEWEPLRKVLGVLGFRRDFLERYLQLDRTPWEVAQQLDQSRLIEHDIPLQSVLFKGGYLGLNNPGEVEMVLACLEKDPLQQSLFSELRVS